MKVYEVPLGDLFTINANKHDKIYRMLKYEGTHAQCEDDRGHQYSFSGTLIATHWTYKEMHEFYKRRLDTK